MSGHIKININFIIGKILNLTNEMKKKKKIFVRNAAGKLKINFYLLYYSCAQLPTQV